MLSSLVPLCVPVARMPSSWMRTKASASERARPTSTAFAGPACAARPRAWTASLSVSPATKYGTVCCVDAHRMARVARACGRDMDT